MWSYSVSKASHLLSDKKLDFEFICEIWVMFDNDPSPTIMSVARDMEVSEFLFRQIVYEDIGYF